MKALERNMQNQNMNPEEIALRTRIQELRGKIKITAKQHDSTKKKSETEKEINERAILDIRSYNSHLREGVREALEQDETLVSEVLSDRKRHRLALGGKSSAAAAAELDQAVCDLARKRNELLYIKKKRQDKLSELQKKLVLSIQAKDPNDRPEFSSKTRQIENSIDKIKIKKSTAFRLHGLYKKICRAVEDEIRRYPKLLDELENQIFSQRTELQNLKEKQHNALAEREVALQEKGNLEIAVREERRKRDIEIRGLRNRVRSSMIEVPQTRGRHNKPTVGEQGLTEMSYRTQEKLDKIKEYQEKADMLEVVTGIPFSNKESLIKCFKNQKNSSTLLRQQTVKKRRLLIKNKTILQQHQQQYLKMTQEYSRSLEEKILSRKKDLEQAVVKKQQLYAENSKISEANRLMVLWLRPITLRLIRSCESLGIMKMNAVCRRAREHIRPQKDLNLGLLFSIFSDIITALHSLTIAKSVHSECALDSVAEKVDTFLLNNNNNRISSTLERKISEDFEYNTPNNDEYLSRTAIKRQAESRQRGSRY